ncbi:hypothetical protein ETAA8_71180 [Anatilimnocola aggregata]|uniref:Cytochrome oxidase complex assembly protein 1 n=1 Tax=Anatilimnocola aggregata TaxID=2528021 RepID=A0A517YP07_9BACT|nr:hypothetical protein [Anatilimnocola aggregata]QDU31956.1 hypothetical protein ETAA8_71180 [Anatilimnocola aggregata]
MSFDPHDPNWRDLPGQAPQQHAYRAPPKKKSNTLLCVLGGVGALLVLLCLGCGGVASMYVWNGLQQSKVELIEQLQPHPLIQEHIGTISSLGMNLGESAALNEGKVGKKTIVFDIKGSKGSALISGEVDDGHDRPARFTDAILHLPAGEALQLSF